MEGKGTEARGRLVLTGPCELAPVDRTGRMGGFLPTKLIGLDPQGGLPKELEEAASAQVALMSAEL